MGDSLRLGEFKSEARGFCRNPVGIRDRSNYVSAGRRMLLFDLTEMGAREPVGKTNQCWPEPSMNECDFATYDAANKNIITVSHRAGQCEYLFALGVGPPTSLERSLRHRLRQGGNRPSTRLQHDTVFSNKFDGLVGGHLWPIGVNPRACVQRVYTRAGEAGQARVKNGADENRPLRFNGGSPCLLLGLRAYNMVRRCAWRDVPALHGSCERRAAHRRAFG